MPDCDNINAMLESLEPSIERLRAELLRNAERDIVLRRLLRGLLDAQRERELDTAHRAELEEGHE